MFDASVDPLVEGGLTEDHQNELENQGWKRATTQYNVTNAGVAFRDVSRPSGVVLKLVDVPAGVDYMMFNPEDGTAAILGCGNETCWRYLI